MEQNRTSTSEAAGTNSEMASRLRRIRQWRERCQQLVNAVADDALETDSSVAVTEEALTSTLRTRLVEQPGFETQTSNHTLGDDDFAQYGGDENDPSACTSSLNQSRFAHPSRQISVSSSISSIGGQAIHIRRTLHATYRCFRDGSNGVMALNENELVFADWYFHGNRQGELKMCVALLDNDSVETSDGGAENESTVQDRVRIVTLPDNIRHMRAVDMEYAPCKSAYIIGLNQHPSTIENGSALLTSWLYLFDTNEDIFEPWVPLSSPQEDFGLANRICCALEKPVIYVITNNHGASNLLLLNEWGVISGRKEVEDLVPEFENVRFIDVACTGKNDLVAIAYNSSTQESEGCFGVRLWDPTTWARVSTLELGIISIPYSVPRRTWVHLHSMFALVNQSNGQLCVFDRAGDIQGQRSFIVSVEDYDPPMVFPINICAAKLDFVAIRYSRFINIHRVIA